jgi:hypothetical protein
MAAWKSKSCSSHSFQNANRFKRTGGLEFFVCAEICSSGMNELINLKEFLPESQVDLLCINEFRLIG